jgi:exosortase
MAEEFHTLSQLAFFSAVGLLLLVERLGAWRREAVEIGSRWSSNIGLLIIGSLLSGLVVPAGLVGFASLQPPGPMARHDWPIALQFAATFLLLDLWQYCQHRLSHHVPLLWRMHLVHHSDTSIDVTTTERHHPLEFVTGTALTLLPVVALGLPAAGVALYLLAATVVSLYAHANLRPPRALDRVMRKLIVTAPLHAIHHSDLKAQTNSNYATVLPLWDRLFGTYVDPDASPVARFGLEYFHAPQDAGLGRVLLQPFLYRRQMRYPARVAVAAAAAPASPHERQWQAALLWGLAALALSALALWPTALDLARLWGGAEAYQYGWLVIPMAAYLLGWRHRREILSMAPQPSGAGVLLAGAGALLWGMAFLANLAVGCHFALVLVLHGLALAVFGWRAYRRFFPALALLFFMVPAGDLLQPALRWITLMSIDLFATLAGLPHQVDGYVVRFGSLRYVVADACTGLTPVLLASFLCYSLGCLLYRSFRKVAALGALGACLGILANALRVNAIVLVDWLRGTQMSLGAHGPFQWAALLLTLALVFLALRRLSASPDAPTADAPLPATGRRAAMAPAMAGLAVLALAGGLRLQAGGQPYPLPRDGTAFAPRAIAEWTLAAAPPAWTVDHERQVASITLDYRHGDRRMRLRLVQALAPAARLSPSDFAPAEQGAWQQGATGKALACDGGHCAALRHATWQRSKGRGQPPYHAYYRYQTGAAATDSALLARAAHGWRRLTGQAGAPRMVGLLFEGDAPDGGSLAAVLAGVPAW